MGLLLQSLKVSESPSEQNSNSGNVQTSEPVMSPAGGETNNESSSGPAPGNESKTSEGTASSHLGPEPSSGKKSCGGDQGDGDHPDEHRAVNLKRW